MNKLATAIVASLLALSVSACSQDSGKAQTAGEKIDNAAESVKDTVLDRGPAEKAGEKIDDAADNLKKSTQ